MRSALVPLLLQQVARVIADHNEVFARGLGGTSVDGCTVNTRKISQVPILHILFEAQFNSAVISLLNSLTLPYSMESNATCNVASCIYLTLLLHLDHENHIYYILAYTATVFLYRTSKRLCILNSTCEKLIINRHHHLQVLQARSGFGFPQDLPPRSLGIIQHPLIPKFLRFSPPIFGTSSTLIMIIIIIIIIIIILYMYRVSMLSFFCA